VVLEVVPAEEGVLAGDLKELVAAALVEDQVELVAVVALGVLVAVVVVAEVTDLLSLLLLA